MNHVVNHGDIRSVLICLMEVGRLSVKYGIDPPALIAMEQEIDCESKDNDSIKISNGTLVNSQSDNQSQCDFGSETSDDNKENPHENPPLILATPNKTTSELGVQTDLSDSVDSGLLADDDLNNHADEESDEPTPTSELDVKVQSIIIYMLSEICYSCLQFL